jgi:ankyrin repeat protein
LVIQDGVTALHAAIDHENVQIALLLLENGADPNQAEANGTTPLHLALDAELPEVVEALCQLGADVNARNALGKTPLELARGLEVGADEVVHLLRRYGAK